MNAPTETFEIQRCRVPTIAHSRLVKSMKVEEAAQTALYSTRHLSNFVDASGSLAAPLMKVRQPRILPAEIRKRYHDRIITTYLSTLSRQRISDFQYYPPENGKIDEDILHSHPHYDGMGKEQKHPYTLMSVIDAGISGSELHVLYHPALFSFLDTLDISHDVFKNHSAFSKMFGSTKLTDSDRNLLKNGSAALMQGKTTIPLHDLPQEEQPRIYSAALRTGDLYIFNACMLHAVRSSVAARRRVHY